MSNQTNRNSLNLPDPSMYQTMHARDHMTPLQLGTAMVLRQTLADMATQQALLDTMLFELTCKLVQARYDLSSLCRQAGLDKDEHALAMLQDVQQQVSKAQADIKHLVWVLDHVTRQGSTASKVLNPMSYQEGKIRPVLFEKLTDY